MVIIASANTQEISSAEDLIKFEINGKTVTLKDELGKKIYDLYKRKTQLRNIANSCYYSIQNGQECAEYNKNGLDKYLTEAVNFYQVYDQILTVEFDGKVYRLDDEIAKNPDNKRWVVDCADITAQNGSNKFNKSGSSCDDNLRFRSEFIKALSQKKEAIQTASNSNASANTQEISSAEDLIKFEINGKTVTLKDELGKKIYDLFENKNGLLAQAERCFENMPTIGTECPSQQKPKFDRILKEAVNAYLIHDKKLISDKGAEFLTNIKMYDYVAQNLKCPTEKLIENTEDRFEDYLSENKFYMDENFQSSLDSQAESNASGVLFKGHDLSNPNFAEIPMVYFLGTAFKGELINCDEYVSLAIEFRGSTKTKEELHALFVEKASQKKISLFSDNNCACLFFN